MKLIIAAAAVIVSAGLAIAYQPSERPGQPGGQPGGGGEQRQPDIRQIGQRLYNSLKDSPGCLGVESVQTNSGKNVIFAWFENKAAAMEWYNSPTHTYLRKSFTEALDGDYQPMEHVPDDVPILTIASLKMGDRPLPGMRMPVSEISIELYTPLPGGIRYAGGFSPEALEVPHRKDIPAPEQAAPKPAGE
jgi:hypothetical protein